jgi:RNA recognition motif-containing protein
MREKEERGAVGKRFSQTLGGTRLTEFNQEKGSSFVNRLNKEATSFFFTNFPEETLVVDLWRVFARFGRIGEVYVPNKVDKRGRRFGFAKFLEVNNVEELSKRMEDVWCGSFKLRVNLSRFGRASNQKQVVVAAESCLFGVSPPRILFFSFCGEGFVGVCLEWGAQKHICFVVLIGVLNLFGSKTIGLIIKISKS